MTDSIGVHSLDGAQPLTVRRKLRVEGEAGARCAGSWRLEGEGGEFEEVTLANQFDSCVEVSAGHWDVARCAVRCSGQAPLHDAQPHTRISTALMCQRCAWAPWPEEKHPVVDSGRDMAPPLCLAPRTTCFILHPLGVPGRQDARPRR